MKHRSLTTTSLILVLTALLSACSPSEEEVSSHPEVRLVLLVTVDQLLGSRPVEYRDALDGGLAWLLDNGTWFSNAHYSHSSTFTSTGHATIATGANIQQHGIAANEWFDQAEERSVYSVSDQEYGRSPANMTTETFGDVLIRESGGQSRVFSVSIKDRGAIIPGGHDGKSMWFSWRDGAFVSSPYFYDELPAWARRWNNSGVSDQFRSESWELLKDPAEYRRLDADDRPAEKGVRKPERGVPFILEEVAFDQTFPHALNEIDGVAYYHALRHAPFADAMTVDFATAAIDGEDLGQRGVTDLLAISLSATDYIGHAFGPNSLEAEDNLFRFDQTIGDLLAFVDEKVGLENTLVVLSSDHGVAPVPEPLLDAGIPAGRHRPAEDIQRINAELRVELGIDDNLVRPLFKPPSFYLDYGAMEKHRLDADYIASRLAAKLENIPGYRRAMTRNELSTRTSFSDPAEERLSRSFHPGRSGDVLVIQEENWFLSSDWQGYSASHGSPHAYDTHVPIIFAGPGIPNQQIERYVEVRDIASTISALLQIPEPRDNAGEVLYEVTGGDTGNFTGEITTR